MPVGQRRALACVEKLNVYELFAVVATSGRIMPSELVLSENAGSSTMNVVRANYLPGFDLGHDAVLLTMDVIGVSVLLSAVNSAIENGSSEVDVEGAAHVFEIHPGRQDLLMEPHVVRWYLDFEKANEVATGLGVLHRSGSAGHVYVDIRFPAPALVLSREEYLHVQYPWIDPPASPTDAESAAH